MDAVTSPPVRAFLLEDNPADVRLFQEAFAELGFDLEIDVARTADEGIEYFSAIQSNPRQPMPAVAILDVHLPAGSGFDVLRHIRSLAMFDKLPALMMTTSDRADDIDDAKRHGATTYYVKPSSLDGFLALVSEIRAFWLERPSP